MPALPSVPKVLSVALSGGITPSERWLSRFFVQYAGTAPTPAQALAYAQAVGVAFSGSLASWMATTDLLDTVSVVDLSADTGSVGEDLTHHQGLKSGSELPATVCLLTSYHVARRYRGGHPRGYWRLGTEEDTVDAHSWSSTFVAGVSSAFGTFFTQVLAAPWTAGGPLSRVNVSYYKGFDPPTVSSTNFATNHPKLRPEGPKVDPITGFQVQSAMATQRRRLKPPA